MINGEPMLFLSVDKIQSVTTEARKVLRQVLEGDAPHIIALPWSKNMNVRSKEELINRL